MWNLTQWSSGELRFGEECTFCGAATTTEELGQRAEPPMTKYFGIWFSNNEIEKEKLKQTFFKIKEQKEAKLGQNIIKALYYKPAKLSFPNAGQYHTISIV